MSNNLEDLTNKLNNLAKQHAHKLTNHEENVIPDAKGEFELKEIAKAVVSLEFLKNTLDEAAVINTIKCLEASINDLLDSNNLTKSNRSKKQMHIVCDALNEIFTSTSEKFRLQYFDQLISFYYEEICKCLLKSESKQVINKIIYYQQVKILLPFVKLKLVTQNSHQENWNKEEKEQLCSNIRSYFKFPRINQEDIYEVIRNKIGSSNFELNSYEMIPLSEKNGHLGEYFQLKITANVEKKVVKLDLFAKFLTPEAEIMKKMVLSGPSKKEEFFYMTYMPFLKKYGLKNLLDFAPKCYFSRINDVLILDDMAANSFVGLTPNSLLNYDSLYEVVQKMAHFHAATMILEEKLSQEEEKRITVYDLYAEFLQEAFFVPDDDYFLKPHFDVGVDTMCYLVLKFPEVTQKFSEEFLKDTIHNGWKLLFQKVKRSDNFKNTICHGDMYVANMLFKINKDKVCHDVNLIDFQLLRYCPPTHDLLFFLHQSCTKETRNKYLRQSCDQYYEELFKIMRNFGYDISKVYPKEDFENSLRYMKSQAVFQALYYSPITMLSPKLREEIFSSQERAHYYMDKYRWKLVDIGLEDDTYKTVMKGLVQDLVELCESGDI